MVVPPGGQMPVAALLPPSYEAALRLAFVLAAILALGVGYFFAV